MSRHGIRASPPALVQEFLPHTETQLTAITLCACALRVNDLLSCVVHKCHRIGSVTFLIATIGHKTVMLGLHS